MTATAGHRRISSRIFHLLLLRTRANFVPEEVRTAPVLEAGQIPFEDVLFATTHCGDFFWLQPKYALTWVRYKSNHIFNPSDGVSQRSVKTHLRKKMSRRSDLGSISCKFWLAMFEVCSGHRSIRTLMKSPSHG